MNDIDLNKIKNIIFDLGVVLLDVDINQSYNAFLGLGINNRQKFDDEFRKHRIFFDHENGNANDADFIAKIKELGGLKCSNENIIDAWNKIIIGFPAKKTDFLLKIKNLYNIYLLSNTDGIHSKKYEKMFLQQTGTPFRKIFKNVYYSHEIGIRKPDTEAYNYVLKDNGLNANETLFIDDLPVNIEAASQLGIKTLLYEKSTDFFNIFEINNNNC